MNYLTITHNDMLNGDGLRVVLWVSGCTLHCEDCQNKYSWNFNEGVFLRMCVQVRKSKELRC